MNNQQAMHRLKVSDRGLLLQNLDFIMGYVFCTGMPKISKRSSTQISLFSTLIYNQSTK